jgi:transcriptional regulator with XRE-family HTH domain
MTQMHLHAIRNDDLHDDGHFGERVRYLRKRQGLTQAEGAKLVGVTPRAWQFWEANRTVPQMGPNLRALASALRVTPTYLLRGEED